MLPGSIRGQAHVIVVDACASRAGSGSIVADLDERAPDLDNVAGNDDFSVVPVNVPELSIRWTSKSIGNVAEHFLTSSRRLTTKRRYQLAQ